ncbi:unnamed protein product, partial [Brassica rapa]
KSAESKDQRADMCTDGQPLTSSTDVLCVLTDSHRRPLCTGEHPRTSCPTWAKITRTVHGKGQRAESKDQRADMCTDGQPRTSHPQTSCVCWRTPTDTHGHTRTATDVLCVLTDSHGRLVCAVGHPRTSCIQPTWAKITRTVHGKGQRAESKDQHADMCTDGQYPVCADGHTRTAPDVLCVLTDTHGCPMCADGHPRTSCVY